jgi:hypothetical protein
MEELHESIRTEGLHNPLQLRWVEIDGVRKLQLVAGERRTRTIKKLVKENVECFNQATGKMTKASELYSEVDAYVSEMDDATAFKNAFSSNDRAIGIGEGSTIALIREFRESGRTDKEILDITGKSTTWLKETDVLIGLDDKTFDALAGDKINRSAALELADVNDVKERMALLDVASNFASIRLAKIKQKLEAEVDAAESKADMAKAKAVVAKHKGDEEAQEEAEAKAVTLKDKAKSKRIQQEEVEEGGPRVTSKDLQKAKNAKQKESGGDGERVALTRAKIAKCWHAPCAALIKADGKDENDQPVEVDLEDVRLAKLLCEQIDKGETDIIRILKKHLKAKDGRKG